MAGGVPRRRGGESLLSHGCAVPAPPEGKSRALRTVPAPRIYEGGGPRSGRGRLPRGGESLLSHGFAVPAPPEGKPRALRAVPAPRIYEGGGPRSGRGSPPPQRGKPPQSRFACQLSQRESQGSCAPITGHSEPVLLSCVRIPRMKGTAERQAFAGVAAAPTGGAPGEKAQKKRRRGFRRRFGKGNTAQLRLRVSAVFLPHFFSLKNQKYIQYSFVFQTLNWGKNPV